MLTDTQVMYDYIHTASDACYLREDRKYRRVIKEAVKQFAVAGKERDLQKELERLVSTLWGDLDDGLGYWYLDVNLSNYMKWWKEHHLIR